MLAGRSTSPGSRLCPAYATPTACLVVLHSCPLGIFAPLPKIPFFAEPCPPPVFASSQEHRPRFVALLALHTSSRLGSQRGRESKPRSTFRQAMLRSDRPGGALGRPGPAPQKTPPSPSAVSARVDVLPMPPDLIRHEWGRRISTRN